MYKKEVKDQGAKVEKMKEENKDEYDIKKQVNKLLSECIVTGMQSFIFLVHVDLCKLTKIINLEVLLVSLSD